MTRNEYKIIQRKRMIITLNYLFIHTYLSTSIFMEETFVSKGLI
jgi:hypothetical protein